MLVHDAVAECTRRAKTTISTIDGRFRVLRTEEVAPPRHATPGQIVDAMLRYKRLDAAADVRRVKAEVNAGLDSAAEALGAAHVVGIRWAGIADYLTGKASAPPSDLDTATRQAVETVKRAAAAGMIDGLTLGQAIAASATSGLVEIDRMRGVLRQYMDTARCALANNTAKHFHKCATRMPKRDPRQPIYARAAEIAARTYLQRQSDYRFAYSGRKDATWS